MGEVNVKLACLYVKYACLARLGRITRCCTPTKGFTALLRSSFTAYLPRSTAHAAFRG